MEKCSLPSLSIFLFATLPSCRAGTVRPGLVSPGWVAGWVGGAL